MRIISLSVLVGLLAVGCGDEEGGAGAAFLTIVGDDDVTVNAESAATLRVRYHDAADQPLAGKISFRIDGGEDVTLSAASASADADGVATVELRLGRGEVEAFEVIAEAPGAEPAVWHINQRPPRLRLTGAYEVESRFVVAPLPDDTFGALQILIELSDDTHDPATWILDRIEGELDGTAQDIFEFARTGFNLDAELNARLLEAMPDVVLDILAVGDDLGDLTRNLGLTTTFDPSDVDAVEGEATSSHAFQGVVFTVDGAEHAFTRTQMSLPTVRAEGITTALSSNGVLLISEHEFALPYGRILDFGVKRVVVPKHDPAADSLPELVAGWLPCAEFGAWVADELDFGNPALYAAACTAGVVAALDDLNAPFGDVEGTLSIEGRALAYDRTGDHDVDEMVQGRWHGVLALDSGEVSLPEPDQTFTGRRVGATEQ